MLIIRLLCAAILVAHGSFSHAYLVRLTLIALSMAALVHAVIVLSPAGQHRLRARRRRQGSIAMNSAFDLALVAGIWTLDSGVVAAMYLLAALIYAVAVYASTQVPAKIERQPYGESRPADDALLSDESASSLVQDKGSAARLNQALGPIAQPSVIQPPSAES